MAVKKKKVDPDLERIRRVGGMMGKLSFEGLERKVRKKKKKKK